jgi:hypothetical protein
LSRLPVRTGQTLMSLKQSHILAILFVVWACLGGGGLAMLTRYSAKAGVGAVSATDWPAESRIRRADADYFLVVFVHPLCPCSRATVAEIDRLLTKCGSRLGVAMVFAKMTGDQKDWENRPLWKQAARLAKVQLVADVGGSEARLFSAATSGQTFLFDRSGHIRFRGGVTVARGHAGDNDGEDVIAAIVAGQSPPASQTPVYGCELFSPSSLQTRGGL